MTPKIAGALILAIPAIVVAWAVLWRRAKPVFWMAFAAILIGTGYLAATGATDPIGSLVLKETPAVTAPAPAPAPSK
ncbi:MAG: hypothetical protein R3D68_04915 [Hyphomicrobiaceae bacterium]